MKTLENIEDSIMEGFESGKLNNTDLVHIIELCSGYLNLQTISSYAKRHKMSYNGVKKCRKQVAINSINFVIDNK